MTLLHYGLNLSSMDMFKVVSGGQLVDDIGNPQPSDPVSSPNKDTQAKAKDDKAIEDAKLQATHPEGTLEENLASEESQRTADSSSPFFVIFYL